MLKHPLISHCGCASCWYLAALPWKTQMGHIRVQIPDQPNINWSPANNQMISLSTSYTQQSALYSYRSLLFVLFCFFHPSLPSFPSSALYCFLLSFLLFFMPPTLPASLFIPSPLRHRKLNTHHPPPRPSAICYLINLINGLLFNLITVMNRTYEGILIVHM